MPELHGAARANQSTRLGEAEFGKQIKRRRLAFSFASIGVIGLMFLAGTLWLATRALTVRSELEAATQLVAELRNQIAGDEADAAASTVRQIASHTAAADDAMRDPIWTLAASLPMVGSNFSAVAEVARSADDVANLALTPLVSVYGSLDWNTLLPSSEGSDLGPLKDASPKVVTAAHAVQASAERLNQIDERGLLPQVADPLVQARSQLQEVTGALKVAADASKIAPGMLGADSPKNYLVMIQNNAESRASGGIPGALAVLTLDQGRLKLSAQSSASDVGVMDPKLAVDKEQQQIYSGRLGKFMQDVNLTPDFPTTAYLAHGMWEKKSGQSVDGVVSLDPIVLSYILEATGPVALDGAYGDQISQFGLPTQLNGQNVVDTLLSEVYEKIEEPAIQDAYFAAVARQTFIALSDGKGDAKGLINGLTRGTKEGRVLLWSRTADEQSVLARYPISGSVSGQGSSPAQFGVYFNDGTGAKMDYHVTRSVQLVKECPRDGYEETTVRITSTNEAPLDAATSLPTYVTGNGNFGVPPGSVQTNIVAYGPAQALVENAKVDGHRTDFAPHIHGNRPVGVLALRLAPGESKTVQFTFSKIVQHADPSVFVTPTVQPVSEVILPTETVKCG